MSYFTAHGIFDLEGRDLKEHNTGFPYVNRKKRLHC